MSTLLYHFSFDRRLEDGLFVQLLTRVPSEMRAKILAFRRWEDAHASILGKLLLMTALRDLGFSLDFGQLRFNPQGRPWIEGFPDFNLSHSGNRVVCVVASGGGRVGVDLEVIRPIGIGDFRGQFTEREWEMIRQAGDPVSVFYQFWTAKEAVIKADGRGLQLPLSGLVIEDRTAIAIEGNNWFLKRCELFPGYACHVAADHVLAGAGAIELVGPRLAELIRNYPT